MDTFTQTPKRNLGATVAVLLAAGLVGLLALMLMSGGGTTDDGALPGNEPALPQNARYPLGLDKFAPGRIAPSVEQPATLSAQPMVCHGEGLMDFEIRTSISDPNGSATVHCSPRARFAGGQDKAPESGYPHGCRDGLLDPAVYADLSDEAILLGGVLRVERAARRWTGRRTIPTTRGRTDDNRQTILAR
jgi:hypothetical protein